MEFHISRAIRSRLDLDDLLFSFSGNVVFANVAASRRLAQRLNQLHGADAEPEKTIHAAALFAMGLIDELSHALVATYRKEIDPAVLSAALKWFSDQVTPQKVDQLLLAFTEKFPNVAVYKGEVTAAEWLKGSSEGMSNREAAFEEMMLLWLANDNPAFAPFRVLFEDAELKTGTVYKNVTQALPDYFVTRPPAAALGTLLDALRAPFLASPDSLTGQLEFIREKWAPYLAEDLKRVLLAIDVLREEEVAVWMRFHPARPDWHRHGEPGRGGEGFVGDEFIGFESEYETGADGVRRRRYATDYQAPLNEYEAFSADQAWMPTVVLIAKSTYVWLEQLSKKYARHIHRLDQIPDEELALLATRGITGLWLIGLWERSKASKTIKRIRGNADAVASAYSLKDYLIAEDLGGEPAYEDLRRRAARAGLRLASDMVPNHMGIDSSWVIEHPEWFLSRWESPFPVYSFEGPDLSTDSRVEIKIEDHYYDQSDAAVVFRLRHHLQGNTRYMYHGNDGTTFAWNDTAQLDYSKAQVREHVIQVILDVARRFPIIRFDAAMVLAKRHVQRLWFPLPGAGGSIPSRAEDAMSQEQFEQLMPHEFWREVVDRVAVEVPGTLLLAEAFWLLEGYFVRTLGMHRVYNSAFMNMLRDEENAKYRSYLKKTVEFDPDILKRYVNFMSNPDERTAIDQFGSGDKYFGVSVLLSTLPGLPMFGHGQIEGFTERYGMDFKQARLDEYPNDGLIARHQHLIAPLLKNRQLFAESTNFVLYDFWNSHGTVDENVFAYSNRHGDQRAIIFYNNAYGSTYGTIHNSVGFLEKASGSTRQRSLADGLGLSNDQAVVIAYRDTVTGLEYLRRARDFQEQGISLGLRGYQHVVLLNWRELWSTESHPWDRLSDLLNGSGVYSVEQAMSELRLRPVFDAVRQTITLENVNAFVAAAADQLAKKAPLPERSKETEGASQATSGIEPKGDTGDAIVSTKQTEVDPKLHDFLTRARSFAETALQLSSLKPGTNRDHAREEQPGSTTPSAKGGSSEEVSLEQLVAASLHLPSTLRSVPEGLKERARTVLPDDAVRKDPQEVWAPVMAWIALQALPSEASALAIYDELQLRKAFAETFSSLGLENELAWHAAAKLRALLLLTEDPDHPSAALRSEAFWSDPDVKWLAGINEAGGEEYLHKECLEAFVCWLELPQLLDAAKRRPDPRQAFADLAADAAELAGAAAESSYKLRRFLTMISQQEKTDDSKAAPTGRMSAVALSGPKA